MACTPKPVRRAQALRQRRARNFGHKGASRRHRFIVTAPNGTPLELVDMNALFREVLVPAPTRFDPQWKRELDLGTPPKWLPRDPTRSREAGPER